MQNKQVDRHQQALQALRSQYTRLNRTKDAAGNIKPMPAMDLHVNMQELEKKYPQAKRNAEFIGLKIQIRELVRSK